MTSYTVYETATGRIVRAGLCQDAMLSEQAATGQAVLGTASNPRTQRVDASGGAPVVVPKD